DDGIRDFHVTGVQTCALPICSPRSHWASKKACSAWLALECIAGCGAAGSRACNGAAMDTASAVASNETRMVAARRDASTGRLRLDGSRSLAADRRGPARFDAQSSASVVKLSPEPQASATSGM